MATQGRGPVPVKFNGGLFTQQLLVPYSDNMKRSGEKTHLPMVCSHIPMTDYGEGDLHSRIRDFCIGHCWVVAIQI